MPGLLSKLAEKKQDQEMRQKIVEERKQRRLVWVNEMLGPCVGAWFSRLRKRLEALKPKEAQFHRGGSTLLRTISIADEEFEVWFGVGYDPDKGDLCLLVYQQKWRESSFPNGHEYRMPLEWPSYKDERVIALLDETWAFVEGNIMKANGPSYEWRLGKRSAKKYNGYWEAFGFEPKTSLLRDPDEDI